MYQPTKCLIQSAQNWNGHWSTPAQERAREMQQRPLTDLSQEDM